MNPYKLIQLIDKGDINSILKLSFKEFKTPLFNGQSIFSILISRAMDDDIIDIIKKNPKYAIIADNNGNTIAHLLGYYNKNNTLIKVLDIYPKVINTQNNNGDTPLFYIIHNFNIFKKIDNKYKPDLSITNNDNDNILTFSIKSYNYKDDDYYNVAIYIIESKRVELNIPEKNPPITVATIRQDINLIKKLHNNGADIDKTTDNYISSLNITLMTGSRSIINYILNNSKNINNNGPEGDHNLISTSILRKNYNAIEKLIDKGYDLEKKNRYLESASHVILDSNVPKNIIKKVLKKINLNEKNIEGITPLHLLLSKHNWKNYKDILKNKSMNIFVKDSEGNTPLSYISDDEIKEFTKLVVKSYINTSPSKKFRKYCNNIKCYDAIFRIIVHTKRSIPVDIDFFKLNDFKLINTPVKNNYGKFNADSVHSILYTLYFIRTFRNMFPIFKHRIDIKYHTEKNEYINLYKGTNRLIGYLIHSYRDLLYELSPYLIVWKDKNNYFIDPELDLYVNKLLISDKIRFIILKLTLLTGPRNTHANIIIYDKKTNTVERFDPYGAIPYMDVDDLDIILKKKLKKIFGKDNFTYLAPKDYMDIAFQTISNDSEKIVKNLGDPFGYCLAWTFWYLEMRITNPNIHPKALVEISIKKINNTEGSDSISKFITFIRNYANKLDKEKNKILSIMNIDDKKHYKLIHNDTDQQIIINNSVSIFNKFSSQI